jgi:hypothetical protein
MGDQNEISLGQLGIICHPAERVDMDGEMIESEHQAAMPDKCDRQVTISGWKYIGFKLLVIGHIL